MPNRARLHSVSIFSALKEVLRQGYGRNNFTSDLFAGLTVGIIALPLSMALAIASGVPPQYGLYTAVIAGILIPLLGGSRYSISGPTAAFVVILVPITNEFGLSGLLVATVMAGVMLVLMSLARLGRLIEYIPHPVTLGFTSGIAVVIATLQINDFLGLQITSMPESYFEKIAVLVEHLPNLSTGESFVAICTLATLLIWRFLKLPIPAYLPAVVVGVIASFVWGNDQIATIGSRFSFELADGSTGFGIPSALPAFELPWRQVGPDGDLIVWDLDLVISLLPAAFSIAMLGAIESLLCAVVLDGMSGRRHHSNGELLAQGVGNIVAPFFGGITATAAIARSAANYKAGAVSPVSACIHGLVILASILVLAPWLDYIPMASMAALLLIVAWNMSEAHKVVDLIKHAPISDLLVFFTCFALTIVVDMVVAISVGVVLASLMFMRDIAGMTKVSDISQSAKHVPDPLGMDWGVYKINGPLFFAAADRVIDEIEFLSAGKRAIILYFDSVPILDAGGLSALTRLLERKRSERCEVIIADMQFQPLRTIARSNIKQVDGELIFTSTLAEAVKIGIEKTADGISA